MNNPVADKIADFLSDFKPFNLLSHSDLLLVSREVKILYKDKGKTLFQVNDALHDCFYVIYSGSVKLTVFADAEETLLNKCQRGDIFGLRPFFAKNNYMMTATAREDAMVYAIPLAVFKPLLASNTEVLDYLLESFASVSSTSKDSKNTISDAISMTENGSEIQYFQALNYSKTTLQVVVEQTIHQVAQLISEKNTDYSLVIENNLPIGIVTDEDFRSKVATGRYPILSSIDKIMSSPVITVTENISLTEAQLLMLKNSVTHLCVTEDGSDKSVVKGIITQNDLIVAHSNNPGVLLKEIKKAKSTKELKNIQEKLYELIQTSISKNIPIQSIAMIVGEIFFALNKRVIELAIMELGTPPTTFAWFSMGSQGRKEQILQTDQDSFLVFDDVAADMYRNVKDYFLKLSKKVTTTLEKIGYPMCANGHVASNYIWCKSLSDWTKQFNNWINTPGENTDDVCSVFFDFELIYGEVKIEETLQNIVFKERKSNHLFYDYLGNEAIKKPAPLNFFKKFNLEEEGSEKGKFDIKTRGLLPLVDAARLFVLSQNIKGNGHTYFRFKQLAHLNPQHQALFLNCAEAFITLSKFRILDGLKNDSQGKYIDLEEFSKLDKEKLKNALLSLKDLEEIIKEQFQLTHFS